MKTDPTRLYEFGVYISQLATDFTTIQTYIVDECTNKTGFTGALTPLQGAMDLLNSVCAEANKQFAEKMTSLAVGLETSASAYGRIDHESAQHISRAGSGS
ncbi:hypothetical protein [Amycolatopsis sp. CA-230715]|uniref:hypothetical protein n=1 Tax=Amycolatopsis sp. CA-230715 TaxID=2745196 RepID=UPI001C01DC1F|nr:hypothetical protein [Amycolatopsis sp. CA-230715]QWF78872.1 hypothetical protein HUW46_02270 [Amycolatopsis sp. CA-230715]